MKPVKIHEAKTHFSKLIGLVETGDEIIVQRGDDPVAKIIPYDGTHPREFGVLRRAIKVGDDFDEIPPGFDEYTR